MLFPDFSELIRLGSKRGPAELGSNRKMLSAASGNYSSPFRGQGLTFHEVREYRPGDDVRNIDWRVTARSNKPHMKVFTEDRERTVILCIDSNASMRFGTRGTFKSIQAARVMALLGRLANSSHDQVGCLLFGDVPQGLSYFKPSRSRRSLWQALKQLSDKTTGLHPSYVPVMTALRYLDRTAPAGSIVFIASAFLGLSKEADLYFASLQRRCDVVLLPIRDPSDEVLPMSGVLRFSDTADRGLAVDTSQRAGLAAYTALQKEKRLALEALCKRYGIGLIDLHTNSDVENDLMPGLHRLAGAKRR